MKPSDELFQLIKSMTKAEKIHFKKFSKRHIIGSSNKYVKLFDEIEKQSGTYDEQLIKEAFAGDRFVNQIHVAKNYLFNLILDSLIHINKPGNYEFQLYDSLKKITVLKNKGLRKPAIKLTERSIPAAVENQNTLALNRLLRLKGILNNYHEFDYFSSDKFENYYREREKNIEEIYVYDRALLLYEKMFALFTNKNNSRREEEIIEMQEIVNDPAIERAKSAAWFDTKNFYYSILELYYTKTGDIEKSWLIAKKKLELINEQNNKYPRLYSSYLSNFIQLSLDNNKNEGLNIYLKELEKSNLSINAEPEKTINYLNALILKIKYWGNTGDNKSLIKVIKETGLLLSEYEANLPARRVFDLLYMLSVSLYKCSEFKEALSVLGKILNHPELNSIREIKFASFFMSLMVNYELGNIELAESLINRTKRSISKTEKLLKTERLLLKFFRNIIKTADKNEIRLLFEELKFESAKNSADAFEKQFIDLISLNSWIEQHLQ